MIFFAFIALLIMITHLLNTVYTLHCNIDHIFFRMQCQREVAELLKGKILVGHALKNDLDVLMLSHPRMMIRDTAKYKPYMRVS